MTSIGYVFTFLQLSVPHSEHGSTAMHIVSPAKDTQEFPRGHGCSMEHTADCPCDCPANCVPKIYASKDCIWPLDPT